MVMSTSLKDLHAQELLAREGAQLENAAIDRRSNDFMQRRRRHVAEYAYGERHTVHPIYS